MDNHEVKNIDCIVYYSYLGEYLIEFKSILKRMFFQLSVIVPIRDSKGFCFSQLEPEPGKEFPELLILCFDLVCLQIPNTKKESQELLTSLIQFRNRLSEQISVRDRILRSTHLRGPALEIIPDDVNSKVDLSNEEAIKEEVSKRITTIKSHIIELKVLKEDFKSIMKALAVSLHSNIFYNL